MKIAHCAQEPSLSSTNLLLENLEAILAALQLPAIASVRGMLALKESNTLLECLLVVATANQSKML
jgi:hypothetical protein